MLEILFTIILILITLTVFTIFIYRKNRIKKEDDILARKNKMEKYFNLKELKREIEDFNNKETILSFHCVKLISKYYSKLIIFNKEYDLDENSIIEIKTKKVDLFNSDFNENFILKSEKEEIKLIINICYYMNNHYQIILDKIEDPLSLAIVLYSKENNFPENITRITKNKLILKDYGDNAIPYLKKYNLINVSRKAFYKMYNTNCSNKIEEKNYIFLDNSNSFFVNFIIKNKNNIEGRIFEQKEDFEYRDFTEEETNFLNGLRKLTSNFTKNKIELLKLKYSIFREYQELIHDKEDIVKGIIEKFYETCFFNKYYGKTIKDEIFDLIDLVIFVCYIKEKA